MDVINDRGAHICKSMLAYLQEGNDREPDKKSDHFVGDWYVRFAQLAEQDPSLEERIQAMLVAREQGDPTIRALRSRMNNRAIAGMQQTYHRYGVSIKKAYFESDHYLKGKAIVEQ